eukprot:CAMPEP_0170593862 /NCGR_PEP_ID=MMETSP0224-20130122/13689_1 /TAXON_ID=285029 /ORGANISM="Togula jolla, Strain CCCM 725" /LENGTH=561 /DNA_ID=CAMNT_0010917873 /DNA_START=137 /DNA_END=1822 /DNA_ORIENTATION=+
MPARPLPIQLTQPDGTNITLQVVGDEHYHCFDDRGFTVVLSAGNYSYATLDLQGRLAPSEYLVGHSDPLAIGLTPGLRPSPYFLQALRSAWTEVSESKGPRHGVRLSRESRRESVKNLVVLCRFKDHTLQEHTRPSQDFEVLWNRAGGDPILAPAGSVNDWMLANSFGQMELNSTVTTWLTLPHNESYYTQGLDGFGAFPTNVQGMVRDALDAADLLVNFGDFDDDDDGYVDCISIIHSGYGAESGGGGGYWVWSHQWVLNGLEGGEWTSRSSNSNGEPVKVFAYHSEAALRGVEGTEISSIGLLVHETMHFFGLEDLYDTSGGGEGIGSYGVMANSWGFDGEGDFPGYLSAWSKIQLGWITPTVISSPGQYCLNQAETHPEVYRIDRGFPPGEYLLVENRQPCGFDSRLPQGGLCIWHVDEAKGDNQDQGYPGQAGWPQNGNHYRVALLQADGYHDLEKGRNRGDAGDVYHAGGKDRISLSTSPSTNSYQNGQSNITYSMIGRISSASHEMTFTYVIEDEDCHDSYARCTYYAHIMNKCEGDPRWMMENCPKVCGLCSGL